MMQKYLFIMGFVASLALSGSACSLFGASDDSDDEEERTGDITGVEVTSTSLIEGGFTPAVSVSMDIDGSLKFTITAADLDGDGTVGTPSLTEVTVSSDDTTTLIKTLISEANLTCTERDIGSGETADTFDIAVSLDTTGSMGAAAGILAGKISDFAGALESAGVDAQFAGMTVGDAFDTKASPSEFTDDVSTGSLFPEDGSAGELPDFDACERPSTGDALIGADDMSTFFSEVESVVGSGCSGNLGTENYLGALQLVNNNLAWRDGSARVMITIGDNCAYTPDTQDEDNIEDPWSPPEPDDLVSALRTNGTVVHVVGNDMSCGDHLNMPDLAETTGGTFTEIGDCETAEDCQVDLTTDLPITSSITGGIVADCGTACAVFESTEGTYTFVLTVDMVDGDTTFTAILAVVVEITLSC